MKREHIWQVKTFGEIKAYRDREDIVVGLYSSKREVIRSLKIWEDNESNSYVIREDVNSLNQIKESEVLHLDYKNGNTVVIFVNRICFNNGWRLAELGGNE